jgi:Ca2+-binding RTX toxin-like protein
MSTVRKFVPGRAMEPGPWPAEDGDRFNLGRAATPGPLALGPPGNLYTFTLTDSGNLVSAAIEAQITANAHYVIDLVSRYVSWQGTLDFVVDIQPASQSPYPAVNGILPSVAQIAWNGSAWINQTLEECLTGVDSNIGAPDAGCTIYLASDGTIRNYGFPVWFDPNPQFEVDPDLPAGQHDFIGIYTHEIFHSLGFYQVTQQWRDHIITTNGISLFTGEAVNALGGPLPFHINSDHYGITSNPAVGITRGLMYEFGNYEGNRLDIGRIDLAVLEDLGHAIKTYDGLPLFEFLDNSPNLSGGAGNDRLYGDYHANSLNGQDGDDLILAGNGNDQLNGGAHDDLLAGGLGADALIGGAGTDTASYADIAAAVAVNLNIGQGFGNHAQGDTYSGIENVIGSSQADFIIGDSGANRLDGGDGDDLLVGSVGADVLVGGNGADTASYGDNWGAVFVNLNIGQGFGNQAQGDTYSGIEHLAGGIFDDFFIGDGGANRLDGGDGSDTLVGSVGGDHLVGGNGTDIASYEDNWGGVSVNLTLGQGFGNAAQGESYDGVENLNGSIFDDFFIGDGAANRLAGRLGADTLVGAGGADSFLFDTALGAANIDTIADFTAVDDTILLDDAVFAGLALGALAAGAFVVGAAAADVDDRILYNQATGALLFDADGSGVIAAVQFATLQGGPAITASDFLVI